MNKAVDDFILTMNRAAEEAAKEAAPIFVDAVKTMTITDGVNILKGNDSAATHYLREKTSNSLHAKFKPIIKSATQKVNVTKWIVYSGSTGRNQDQKRPGCEGDGFVEESFWQEISNN